MASMKSRARSAPPKKKSKACDQCKTLKVKCTRENPNRGRKCDRCYESHKKCTYTRPTKKSGRPPKKKQRVEETTRLADDTHTTPDITPPRVSSKIIGTAVGVRSPEGTRRTHCEVSQGIPVIIEIADGNRLNHEYLSFAYEDDQPREAVLKTSRLSPGLYVIDRVKITVKARDVFDLFGDHYNSIPERSHSKKNARVEMHAEDVGLNDDDKDLIIQYASEHKYTYFFILDLKQIDLVAYHADAWERLAEGGHPVLEEDTLYQIFWPKQKK